MAILKNSKERNLLTELDK